MSLASGYADITVDAESEAPGRIDRSGAIGERMGARGTA